MPTPLDPYGDVQPIDVTDLSGPEILGRPEPPAWAGEQLSAWLASMRDETPAVPALPPMPTALGIPESTLTAAAGVPEPAPPPGLKIGRPRLVTGELSPEEMRIGAPEDIKVPPLTPAPGAMNFFGAPATGPIDQVEFAKQLVARGVGDMPGPVDPYADLAPSDELEMPAESLYTNPLENPNLTPEQQGAELADLAARDPERAARIMAMHEDTRREITAARELQAAQEAADQAAQIAAMRQRAAEQAQQAVERLDAEATQLASARIDPDRWWNSRSTGGKVSGFIAAIVGGLMQGRTGGRNTGLDLISAAIEQDIAVQQQNLAHQRDMLGVRRSAIGDRLKLANEAADAADMFRLAAYKRIEQQLDTERQQFDPRGTRAMRYAQMLSGVRQAQAQAQEALRQRKLKEGIEIGRFEIDAAKAQADIEKTRAETARTKARGVGVTGSADKIKYTPEQLKTQFGNVPGVWVPPPGSPPMTIREYSTLAEAAGKGQKVTAEAPATGLSKDELERVIPGLETEDGKPFFAVGGPAEAQKLRNTRALTESLARIMDNVLRLRKEHGWSSDLFKRPEWQEQQALWANAMLVAKGDGVYQLGVLAGPDIGMLGKGLGATDPTAVIDPTPGIMKSRQILLDDFNTKARSLAPPGVKLKRFDIRLAAGLSEPTTAPGDAAFEDLRRHPLELPLTRVQKELGIGGYNPDLIQRYGGNPAAQLQGALSDAGGMLPSQRQTLNDLADTATSSPSGRADALDKLDRAAREAASPAVRDYARTLFVRASSASIEPDAVSGGKGK